MEKELKTSESQRRAAKKYYEKMKNDPDYRAKKVENTSQWLLQKADLNALKNFHERRLKEIQQFLDSR